MDARTIVEIIVLVIVGTLIFLYLLLVPIAALVGGRSLKNLSDEKDKLEARNAVRQTLIQAAGGLLLAGTLAASAIAAKQAYENLDAQRDAQITDRYAKAVDQLGNKDPSVRAAAMFALARVSQDSERDRDTIIQAISAFARSNSPRPVSQEEMKRQRGDRPRADILAAMIALGRINLQGEARRLRLDEVYLVNANLRAIQLPKALFHRANLAGLDASGSSTNLRNVDFSEAILTCANLSWADISSNSLKDGGSVNRTNLRYAILTGANLQNAKLQGALMRGARLDYANLRGADLSDVKGLKASQLEKAFIDDKTKLPESIGEVTPYDGGGYKCWKI
ncbi:pentapeptide repeat-containing protein [Streptomyces sp. NPDC005374]|uniref:pentapeptide repeat-containing protein n=1 Tax=Streptomyces sp. NPDC005374 TaxID=3364713 RepID=UPI0036830A03